MVSPATAATTERGHSSLKYLKNDLHFAMSEDRMNTLMLLYIWAFPISSVLLRP